MLKSFIISFLLIALTISIQNVRDLYKNASKSKTATELFYNKLKQVKETDKPLIVGYKSASIALKARFEKGIKNKKRTFKQGANLLEKQIKRAPKNIELRFIRLSIQENSPKILGYNKNIKEDKIFIINNLKFVKSKRDLDYFKGFINQSKSFTKQEKVQLTK